MLIRLIALVALPLFAVEPDVQEIVRKSLDRELQNQKRLKDYTWENKSIETSYDKSGKVTKTKIEVHENVNIDGSSYRKLIERDGKPLPEKEQKKEQEEMDKEIAKRRNESDADREKRQKKDEERRREAIKFREEVIRAFDFKLMGEESVNGFPCWRIQGIPRHDFEGKSRQGKMLNKMQGEIWVEKNTYEWLKFDVLTIDKISFGGFLASLAPGARIQGQQMRVNNELWHPEWIKVRLNARALVKTFNIGAEETFRNFRKFQTDSRVVEISEIPEVKDQN